MANWSGGPGAKDAGVNVACPVTTAGATSVDYFRVQTCALPLGVYEHRLTLTTTNGAAIRGVEQTATLGIGGTPNTIDADLQTNQATPRFNVWYGFGKQEQLYYRVTGTAATTAQYTATLSTTPITPTNLGTFAPGSITITSVGQGHTNDTDLWVYDSTFTAIPTFGNDDQIGGGTFQSRLVRTYSPGVYYLALTGFDLANEHGAAADENKKNSFTISVTVQGTALKPIPSSKDAKLKGTPFHARSIVDCTVSNDKKRASCDAYIIRYGGGSATVEFRAGRLVRRVLFVKGIPKAHDSQESFTYSRSGEDTTIKFGDDPSEKYLVPDALIFGG